MMRPGSGLEVAEEEEDVVVDSIDGSHDAWGLGMYYLLISSEICWWKKVVTDGPTDTLSYRRVRISL